MVHIASPINILLLRIISSFLLISSALWCGFHSGNIISSITVQPHQAFQPSDHNDWGPPLPPPAGRRPGRGESIWSQMGGKLAPLVGSTPFPVFTSCSTHPSSANVTGCPWGLGRIFSHLFLIGHWFGCFLPTLHCYPNRLWNWLGKGSINYIRLVTLQVDCSLFLESYVVW